MPTDTQVHAACAGEPMPQGVCITAWQWCTVLSHGFTTARSQLFQKLLRESGVIKAQMTALGDICRIDHDRMHESVRDLSEG